MLVRFLSWNVFVVKECEQQGEQKRTWLAKRTVPNWLEQVIFDKPNSQSCAVAKNEKFWQPTEQSNLADRMVFWNVIQYSKSVICGLLEPVLSLGTRFLCQVSFTVQWPASVLLLATAHYWFLISGFIDLATSLSGYFFIFSMKWANLLALRKLIHWRHQQNAYTTEQT